MNQKSDIEYDLTIRPTPSTDGTLPAYRYKGTYQYQPPDKTSPIRGVIQGNTGEILAKGAEGEIRRLYPQHTPKMRHLDMED